MFAGAENQFLSLDRFGCLVDHRICQRRRGEAGKSDEDGKDCVECEAPAKADGDPPEAIIVQ